MNDLVPLLKEQAELTLPLSIDSVYLFLDMDLNPVDIISWLVSDRYYEGALLHLAPQPPNGGVGSHTWCNYALTNSLKRKSWRRGM